MRHTHYCAIRQQWFSIKGNFRFSEKISSWIWNAHRLDGYFPSINLNCSLLSPKISLLDKFQIGIAIWRNCISILIYTDITIPTKTHGYLGLIVCTGVLIEISLGFHCFHRLFTKGVDSKTYFVDRESIEMNNFPFIHRGFEILNLAFSWM